jgi:hypothetical protein
VPLRVLKVRVFIKASSLAKPLVGAMSGGCSRENIA